MPGHTKSLKESLNDGEFVLCAEGYLFEFERRGYLKAGSYVPEVVLEHPELVRQLHEEFVHAGTDVVQAFTYYGHREKLRLIGREHDLEPLNRKALEIAKTVALESGTLMAGNICNTTVFDPSNPSTFEMVRAMFKESIQWAVEGGADFIIAETFENFGEAKVALEAIKAYGNGLPAVVTMSQIGHEKTADGYTYPEACKYLEDNGATAAGLNCSAGPDVQIPRMREIRKLCTGPIACLPVPYRTTRNDHHFHTAKDPKTGKSCFPEDLDAIGCAASEMTEFGKQCKEIGIQYVGICCGNSSRYFRKLAESLGRRPPASRYSPDMSQHFLWGSDPSFKQFEKIRQKQKYIQKRDTFKAIIRQ